MAHYPCAGCAEAPPGACGLHAPLRVVLHSYRNPRHNPDHLTFTQLATCDAARALLLRVAEAQHTRHGRPLRVRCQPDSSGYYQSDAVWQPAASTIRVNCHNAQPTQVGSLLFELLNANVRLPISPQSCHRRSTIRREAEKAGSGAACC